MIYFIFFPEFCPYPWNCLLHFWYAESLDSHEKITVTRFNMLLDLGDTAEKRIAKVKSPVGYLGDLKF